MKEPFQSEDENRWLILIVTTLGAFMTPFDTSAVNLAIPSIGLDLGGELLLLSWIPVAYLLALTTFLIVSGRLGDVRGRKSLYIIGTLIFTFSSALSGLSNSLYQLITARVGQGIGASMMSGNSVAFATSAFLPSQRGKAVGIITAATYTGLSMGPVLGGLLISEFGWRSIFYLNVPLGLITAVLCHFKTYERFEIRREASLDVLGALSLTISLSSILASVSLSQIAMIPRQYVLGLISIGVLSLLFFVFVEKRFARQPLVDVRLFTENRVFAFSNLTAFLHYLASYGIGFLMSLYLQLILRLDPYQAGLVMLSQPFLMAAVSPFSGHLSDRIEPRLLSSIGLVIMTAAILILSGVSNETTTNMIVLILIVLGFGYGLFSSPNTSAVMGSVPKESLGLGSGVLATMRFLGQSFSLALVTFVLTSSVSADILIVGKEQLNVPVGEFLFGVRAALRVCAVIGATAVIVSAARGKMSHVDSSPTPSLSQLSDGTGEDGFGSL